MADANVNTGRPLRWSTAGLLILGTVGSGFTPLWIVAGSLEVVEGRREGVAQMDRGALTNTVLVGDERPSRITFKVRPTKNGMTGAAELLAKLFPADASDGTKTLQNVTIDWPDAPGSSTGVRATFTNCWTIEAPTIQSGGAGQTQDEMTIVMQSEDAQATFAQY